MVTVLAPDVDDCCFRRTSRGSDDDTGNTDKMRNVGGIEITDRDVCCGRVQEQLMRREDNVSLGREHNPLCALLEGSFELWTNRVSSLPPRISPSIALIPEG